MRQILETRHEGALLQLHFDNNQPRATLTINGVIRETVSSIQPSITLKLTSPLQTGYEYHDFLEAIVKYTPTEVSAVLQISDTELIHTTIERTTVSDPEDRQI
ncbi:MAG: hypothetical protein KUG79_01780 [Pseudomonadales bacterium]|nr:hypothetical protein [Pseudomonadales bacterium]